METEYAIRFVPDASVIPTVADDCNLEELLRLARGQTVAHAEHPGNDVIFEALSKAIGRIVATRPGNSAYGRDQIFTQNGGAFYYESLPHCPHGGLIEGSTPECRGPGQALLYQRAQEALLLEAAPVAEQILARGGHCGHLSLVKNSRDAEGNVFGSQENYEVNIARGPSLALYRLGLALVMPLLAVQVLLTYAFLLALIVFMLGGVLLMLLFPSGRRWVDDMANNDRKLDIALGRFQLWVAVISTWPALTLHAGLMHLFAFRRIRRELIAFIVSRPVVIGTGAVDGDHFVLSEKAPATRRVMRRSIMPEDRPLFDTGNLLKMYGSPFNLQWRPLLHSFRKRQRLQLGCADSNRAQVAEFLKLGTTALILDMIEEGFLKDAPRPVDPVEALHQVVADPNLKAPVRLRGGKTMTALEIQRFYLEKAKEYLRQSSTASVEAREVVRLWEQALDALDANDLGSLVGRLDWVTKRYLLEQCSENGRASSNSQSSEEPTRSDLLQTVAIRYHELGDGYFARLEKAGETTMLLATEEAQRAVTEAPENTPAFLRGGLIRRQAGRDVPIVVSWDSAYIGKRLRGGKLIPFRRPRR